MKHSSYDDFPPIQTQAIVNAFIKSASALRLITQFNHPDAIAVHLSSFYPYNTPVISRYAPKVDLQVLRGQFSQTCLRKLRCRYEHEANKKETFPQQLRNLSLSATAYLYSIGKLEASVGPQGPKGRSLQLSLVVVVDSNVITTWSLRPSTPLITTSLPFGATDRTIQVIFQSDGPYPPFSFISCMSLKKRASFLREMCLLRLTLLFTTGAIACNGLPKQ